MTPGPVQNRLKKKISRVRKWYPDRCTVHFFNNILLVYIKKKQKKNEKGGPEVVAGPAKSRTGRDSRSWLEIEKKKIWLLLLISFLTLSKKNCIWKQEQGSIILLLHFSKAKGASGKRAMNRSLASSEMSHRRSSRMVRVLLMHSRL